MIRCVNVVTAAWQNVPEYDKMNAQSLQNTTCMNGQTTRRSSGAAWMHVGPLLVLVVLALLVRPALPPWAFMWALAFAIFYGCKWMTLQQVDRPATIGRRFAYLFLWTGMDAVAFLNPARYLPIDGIAAWLWPVTKITTGATLLWGVARFVFPGHPLAAIWIGMVGMVFMLHFGVFDLIAFLWRRAGVDAQPLMRAPMFATSLAEFWGRRWNMGFHKLAEVYVFKPMLRRVGGFVALVLVFVVSGVLHDAVISLPAGGGYGLPTFYFALQPLGIALQRGRLGRRLGLNRAWRGLLVVVLFTVAPLRILFHDPFVFNVMLPFMRAIRALPVV